MKPVGEELLGSGFAHSSDGEVVLLAGEGLDSVVVDGADFVQCDLDTVTGVIGAAEVKSAGVERELAGAAAEVLLVVG